jgi:hypothetical protein
MSLSKEDQTSSPSPSPAGRRSDGDEKERTSEANTKPEEAKGGMNHYFVSGLVCKTAMVH